MTNNTSIGEAGGGPTGLGTTGGVVTDSLPAGLQFVASSSCSNAGATLTCHVGPVAPGAIVTASFTARVAAGAAGTAAQNTATVATEAAGGFARLPDFNSSDDTDHASLTVNLQADLSLTKTVSNPNPRRRR